MWRGNTDIDVVDISDLYSGNYSSIIVNTQNVSKLRSRIEECVQTNSSEFLMCKQWRI